MRRMQWPPMLNSRWDESSKRTPRARGNAQSAITATYSVASWCWLNCGEATRCRLSNTNIFFFILPYFWVTTFLRLLLYAFFAFPCVFVSRFMPDFVWFATTCPRSSPRSRAVARASGSRPSCPSRCKVFFSFFVRSLALSQLWVSVDVFLWYYSFEHPLISRICQLNPCIFFFLPLTIF